MYNVFYLPSDLDLAVSRDFGGGVPSSTLLSLGSIGLMEVEIMAFIMSIQIQIPIPRLQCQGLQTVAEYIFFIYQLYTPCVKRPNMMILEISIRKVIDTIILKQGGTTEFCSAKNVFKKISFRQFTSSICVQNKCKTSKKEFSFRVAALLERVKVAQLVL